MVHRASYEDTAPNARGSGLRRVPAGDRGERRRTTSTDQQGGGPPKKKGPHQPIARSESARGRQVGGARRAATIAVGQWPRTAVGERAGPFRRGRKPRTRHGALQRAAAGSGKRKQHSQFPGRRTVLAARGPGGGGPFSRAPRALPGSPARPSWSGVGPHPADALVIPGGRSGRETIGVLHQGLVLGQEVDEHLAVGPRARAGAEQAGRRVGRSIAPRLRFSVLGRSSGAPPRGGRALARRSGLSRARVAM